MDNGLFTNIYTSLCRLFTQQEILFRPVSGIIPKWLFITRGIECNSDYSMMYFKVLDTQVFIIRSPKEKEFVSDMMLHGNEPIIIFVIPKDICDRENDVNKIRRTVDFIYVICGYLCTFIMDKFAVNKKSSLYKVLVKAPSILTIYVASKAYILFPADVQKYIPKGDDTGDIEFNVNKIMNYGIGDLLDFGGVLAADLYQEKNKPNKEKE